jgi:C1A family cysteine protease
MSIVRKFGWKPQKDDPRDLGFERLLKLKNYTYKALPPVVNNRYWCSAVEDQGSLGSCTGNAWAALLEYNACRNGFGGKQYKDLSRLFIYYNERVLEGTVNEDAGAYLRDGAKTLARDGVCLEQLWPYHIVNFDDKPTPVCYTNALQRHIHSYYALNSLADMKTCLANRQCFVFGFLVYESFMTQEMANTGIAQMPKPGEECLGGHAVMAVGYNDYEKKFLIKNSWGRNWGLKKNNAGYFTLPYEYMSNWNLVSDFWTVALTG